MRNGWKIIAVIAIFIAFNLAGLAGYYYGQRSLLSTDNSTPNLSSQDKKEVNDVSEKKEENELGRNWSRGQCEGKGTVKFGTLPMKTEDFSAYLPYGLMVGAHVTPIDHGYFSPTDFNSPRDKYEVRAIADGVIVEIQHRTNFTGDKQPGGKVTDEYRIIFEHTCTFYSYFDLVTSLAPEIKAQTGEIGSNVWSGRIPVKEGQLIGRIGGQTLDFGVYNAELTLPGFVIEDHYEHEFWKIHTDDPFKYFTEPARSQLLAKNVRKAEPRAGKIDYDIDGKLVGNWFKENTNGYAGANLERYWDGHLTVAYDYIDPTQVRFSIGNFDGEAGQFGVKGNGPDPSTVDKNTGLVKYELVQFGYYNKATGADWRVMEPVSDPAARNYDRHVMGVALLQLIDKRKLKVEVFPNKTASQVSGFTDKALIYER